MASKDLYCFVGDVNGHLGCEKLRLEPVENSRTWCNVCLGRTGDQKCFCRFASKNYVRYQELNGLVNANGLSGYRPLFGMADGQLCCRFGYAHRYGAGSKETPSDDSLPDHLHSLAFTPNHVSGRYPAIAEEYFPGGGACQTHLVFRFTEGKAGGVFFNEESAHSLGTLLRICPDKNQVEVRLPSRGDKEL